MWMGSPGHRENLLRPRSARVGLGLARGAWHGRGALYVTADFGAYWHGPAKSPSRGGLAPQGMPRAADNRLCMSDSSQEDHLPSGKAVEIVYLQSAPGATARPTRRWPPRRSSRAPSRGELVYPFAWHELSPGRWEIERRCPDCEWEATGVHGEAEVQRYDALLNEGTDALIEHVEQLAHDTWPPRSSASSPPCATITSRRSISRSRRRESARTAARISGDR